MSFQPIFDNAADMKISNRRFVAQTQTRSGVVRSVSQNNSIWRFTISLADGQPWENWRTYISGYENLNRYTTASVNLSQSGFSYMFPYQGDESNIANLRVSVINGELRVQSGVTITSGYLFLVGDLIQLVGGRVYQVTQPVLWSDTSISTHRAPVDEPVGTYDTNIGELAEWEVICTTMPKWSFVDHKRVGWDGPFEFQEAM